ncbi:BTAD domain-containing putative transcriptional regulator [Streptomyces sp. RK75]|uniref:BTAD domain-containing putative transcriptional regulator n=1 Tax=Streptomyces sp. RK75 TaxID=2824895 RepID=UPI001FFD0684|nr:BTAD domain-containing putative transcriptional regulator [Streptomyces sp. RK75]
MRFEVLGSVTVRTADGAPVAVPEGKVRALLADLLVHLGRPVPVDRLIDDLWGDETPGNPGNTLQTKVSQLRRVLTRSEPDARDLIAYGAAGYALRAPDDAVDAGRFAELITRARRLSEPRARVVLLAEALELWRGEAYADFRDAPFAQATIAHLEEQRLTAQEELAELRLDLGESAALADELASLAAAHPLRQRLWASLMRALYRSGRQSEALTAYRELQRRFAEELGIDPGPELAALHEAILRQDPALAPVPAAPSVPRSVSISPPASAAPPPSEPPRGASAPQRAGVPAPLSSLVGRRETIPRLCALVESARLVTLTGPGGVGKTRLALAAASRLADGSAVFADGVRFVELAGTGREVAETVAVALGIRDDTGHPEARDTGGAQGGDARSGGAGGASQNSAGDGGTRNGGAAAAGADTRNEGDGRSERNGRNGGSSPKTDGGPETGQDRRGAVRARLVDALAARRLLLVLDNCEHLASPVAELVGYLLGHAPGLHVLATSQEPLALSGEVLEAVAPLAEKEAMELFAERAAAAGGFTLDAGNIEAVALICRRLDGIPLALELAATRVRTLGVHTLADRLHDRFRLLNQVRRDAPARQRTLRAMIDWSWELLSPPEQTLLRRLAVFVGGFTLESAESVCAGEGIATDEVLDLLSRLVDRSLVVVAHEGQAAGRPRYRMLESVLAYGLERLEEAGEADDVRHRHARHFTELAEHACELLYGHDQRYWLQRLDAESRNLRSALALEVAESLGLRLVNALSWYWFLRGRVGEALRHLDQVLARTPVAAGHTCGPARASARARRAAFALLSGADVHPDEDFDGADVRSLWLLAYARCGFGNPRPGLREAVELTDLEALGARFRALGDRWGEAALLSVRATRAVYQGDLVALRQHAEAAATLFREFGDRWGHLQSCEQLGVLAEIAGDYAAAARLHQDCVRDAEELQLWTSASFGLARLGRIALLTGHLEQATEYHEQARRLAAEQSHRPAEQFAVTGLALGARRRGDLETAQTLLRPWLEWNRRFGVDSGTALILAQLGYAAEQRGDAEGAETLHREGLAAARRTGDPRALALALEGLAGAHAAADHPERAACLLGRAAALRDSVGMPLPAAERVDVDRASERARASLGEAEFASAFARGRAGGSPDC